MFAYMWHWLFGYLLPEEMETATSYNISPSRVSVPRILHDKILITMLNIATVLCVIFFVSVANGENRTITSLLMSQVTGNRIINNAMLENENKFATAYLRAVNCTNQLTILLDDLTTTQESEMRNIITTAGDRLCGNVRNCSTDLYTELNETAANTLQTIYNCGYNNIGWCSVYKEIVVNQKEKVLKLMQAFKEEFNKCPLEDSVGDFVSNGNCTYPILGKMWYSRVTEVDEFMIANDHDLTYLIGTIDLHFTSMCSKSNRIRFNSIIESIVKRVQTSSSVQKALK